MISQAIYKDILAEYEKLTDDAKKKIELKKEICYKKCKRIKEIDDELNMTAIKISKAIIYAGKDEKQKYIEDIKNLTESLKKEKESLMAENGFSKNYFDDVYICNKCKDTGFINNKKCECFKQKLINKAYNMSNIAEIIKTENFSKFSLDYYSKQIDKENNMSPYENMKFIIRKCSLFVEEFDDKFKNMVFYGNTGLGKTFLCRCIAKELLDKGKIVLYVTAFNLFSIFENQKFNKDNEEINKEILNLVKEADLFIIDDLGTEFITSLSTTELFDIINSRILERKSTIISTNLSPDEIVKNYSNRIVSRLYGEYDMIKFFGNDIRIIKKLKNKV
ncbi:ATP-binding protein [uncultured Tyzzerella sp.]|uniref:ATP-binding protein n=1 Tax=uncultured Tyzzerella sp. TaxID=2321398 RepID=UPI002942C5F5|nr:ATP-binding protein [uncultured Tyzzerella sp.]